MTFEVSYSSEATDDIDLAFAWFAARAPSAAADFLRAIGRAEIHLQRNPAIYRVVRQTPHGEVRRVNIRPYRYQLYFLVVGSTVMVIPCIHATRSPRRHAQIVRGRA
jgi:plasmid stabilization system protein ParE